MTTKLLPPAAVIAILILGSADWSFAQTTTQTPPAATAERDDGFDWGWLGLLGLLGLAGLGGRRDRHAGRT